MCSSSMSLASSRIWGGDSVVSQSLRALQVMVQLFERPIGGKFSIIFKCGYDGWAFWKIPTVVIHGVGGV